MAPTKLALDASMDTAMADGTMSTSSIHCKRRGKQKKQAQKKKAGIPTSGTPAYGPSQANISVPSGLRAEAALPRETDEKAPSPLKSSAAGGAKETVISNPQSLPHDLDQGDGQPESSRARESHPVGTEGTSSKNARWTAKRGKKFVALQLGSAQPLPVATNSGSTTYAQQAKGASSHQSSAVTTKPAVLARTLPEKEFSENHFPELGSTIPVKQGKRASAKPSEWAPSRDPERDEAERLALLKTDQRRAEEEGRLSWLRDPFNPANEGAKLPSTAATPTDGAWTLVGDSTAGFVVERKRPRIFKAPYVFDESWKFGKAYQNQNSKLFVLATEMLTAIFYRLDRKSRVKFAQTSRASSTLIGILLTVWDMTDGNFCDAEKGPMGTGSPTAMTIITEFHSSAVNVVGHEVNVLKTMTLAVSLWTPAFRTLEFHRAPLVTARLLSILLPSLPNLESLGVFACDLINIGDSLTLLEIIRDNVQLDFFPRRPISLDVNIVCRLALPAMLFQILPLAKKKNSRLMEQGSAFSQYLELELPIFPRDQYENIANGIQDAELTAIISSWKEGFRQAQVDPKSNNARYWECTSCDMELRGCFFAKAQLRDFDNAVCWGCKLKDALDDEKYDKNFSGHRHAEVEKWLENAYSLKEAVEAINKECKTRHAEKTFPELKLDDQTAKMARSHFWNPKFHQEAKVAWQKGEDPNEWWPNKRGSSRRNGRRGGRNRGGW